MEQKQSCYMQMLKATLISYTVVRKLIGYAYKYYSFAFVLTVESP